VRIERYIADRFIESQCMICFSDCSLGMWFI